jgi:hypothetical protein
MKTVWSILVVSTAGLLAAGCGKSGSSGSSVTGSVTYKGSPVTGGNMLFHGKDKTYGASLGADGKYTCTAVPPGDYVVTIDNKHLEKAGGGDPEAMMKKMAGGKDLPADFAKSFEKMKAEKAKANIGAGEAAAKYVPIPEKYAKAETSGLKVTVGSGNNQKDFPLTD